MSILFTEEETKDLEYLKITEILNINIVRNYIKIFPPKDIHDVLIVFLLFY